MVSYEEEIFQYTKKRALVIANFKYDELRKIDKLENADDLPEAEVDLNSTKGGLARMKFSEDEITVKENPTYE